MTARRRNLVVQSALAAGVKFLPVACIPAFILDHLGSNVASEGAWMNVLN